MNDSSLISAIVGHLVGDYILQNDWMALNKKKSSLHCAIHCMIWSWCVIVFSGWQMHWLFAILFTTHFIQDRTNIVIYYMKFYGQYKFSEPPMAPWSIIVVDNVFHIVTLWAIWRYL